MVKFEFDAKRAIEQLAVNAVLGAVLGFGVSGWLMVFPEKGMKAGPLTSTAIGLLSFSSGAGFIVSIVHLRRSNND